MRGRYDYQWQSRLTRAYTQRIYLMPDAARMASDTEFHFDIMGSTETAYHVSIEGCNSVTPSGSVYCSCPDHTTRGNFCKHLMLLMTRVLRIPEAIVFEDYGQSADNRDFSSTPRTIEYCHRYFAALGDAKKLLEIEEKEKRKPIEADDDCPICYESFAETKSEATVWCRGGCGKSVHTGCFSKWAERSRGDVPSCVYCRTQWVFN